MHGRWKLVSVVLFLVIVWTPSRAEQSEQADSSSARQIDQILSEIQVALLKVQNEAVASSLPQLASVLVDLETEFAYDAGGELKLYVISIDGTVKHENVQRVALTLIPPKPYSEEPIASGQISESLSSAILAAAKGITNARKRTPPLTLSKLDASIKFVVKAVGGAGIKVDLLPITAGIKGDISKAAIQTITVTFEGAGK
jgi:hypothetical protein